LTAVFVDRLEAKHNHRNHSVDHMARLVEGKYHRRYTFGSGSTKIVNSTVKGLQPCVRRRDYIYRKVSGDVVIPRLATTIQRKKKDNTNCSRFVASTSVGPMDLLTDVECDISMTASLVNQTSSSCYDHVLMVPVSSSPTPSLQSTRCYENKVASDVEFVASDTSFLSVVNKRSLSDMLVTMEEQQQQQQESVTGSVTTPPKIK